LLVRSWSSATSFFSGSTSASCATVRFRRSIDLSRLWVRLFTTLEVSLRIWWQLSWSPRHPGFWHYNISIGEHNALLFRPSS
jgi:hypothetical protein